MLPAWRMSCMTLMMMAMLVPLAYGVAGSGTVEPRKCCFDKQFSAILGEVGATVQQGHPLRLGGNIQLAYDFYRARQGSINSLRQSDGSFKTTYVLADYISRITYSREEGGVCSARHMTQEEQMYPPCVPDDATYLGTATVGYGTEALDIHSWQFMLPNSTVKVKMAVNEHCVPFAQAMFGDVRGADTEITYFFTAYHPGIEDLDVLNTPSDCPLLPANSTSGSQVGRRSIRLF